MPRQTILKRTSIDGEDAIMRYDQRSGHTTLMWGGQIRPDGPGHRTARIPKVAADVPGFTRVGHTILPLASPQPG